MVRNFVVAEYSVSQKCFHVHDLKSMLTHNIENMIGEGSSDYIPIGVFDTDLEAHRYIETVREQMKKYGCGSWVNDLLKNLFK
jgi:hypothetical protein